MKNLQLALTACAISALLFAVQVPAQSSTIFAANYQLDFEAGDQDFSIQNRDRVRAGHEIPMELQGYKVGLQIEAAPDGAFLLRINIYQRNGVSWYLINAPAPEFGGALGMPMEISWESADLRIELAIAVSEYRVQA